MLWLFHHALSNLIKKELSFSEYVIAFGISILNELFLHNVVVLQDFIVLRLYALLYLLVLVKWATHKIMIVNMIIYTTIVIVKILYCRRNGWAVNIFMIRTLIYWNLFLREILTTISWRYCWLVKFLWALLLKVDKMRWKPILLLTLICNSFRFLRFLFH